MATPYRVAIGLLLAAAGLGMAVPGAYLAALGGSPYYLLAGASILSSAVLILRRNGAGPPLYGLVFLASLAWSLWEVGLDPWALMPRLVFLAVAGLFVAAPWLREGLVDTGPRARLVLRAGLAVVLICLVVTGWSATQRGPGQIVAYRGQGESSSEPPASSVVAGDWAHYGNTMGGTRYSPLDQITPANAPSLRRAWSYDTRGPAPSVRGRGGLEMTPLMVDGAIYGCTETGAAFAVDALSGRQFWRYEPPGRAKGLFGVCRGVAFYRAPPAVTDCPTRLLMGTTDDRLLALDAKTGHPCRAFGVMGQVNLREGLGDFPAAWTRVTSPPAIVKGVAVIGHLVIDNRAVRVPAGVVRGYDAVTGALKWAFDPGRPGDPRPLPPGQAYTPSTPNAWSIASGDEQLGLVYLPMGNGSPDLVGTARSPETEHFSTSVVALDAATGQVRWSFQAVHHDLWDYDLAAQPVLGNFPTPAGPAPALFQATKTGQIFVLDRRDGHPLTPVVERPVPRSDVPGERSAPTQPYSVGMPEFAGPDLTEADMWGLTPFDQLACRIQFRQARYKGMFTPPRLGPTIRYPGELGGIDWGSVALDEGRGVLVVNSNHMADLDVLMTRAEADLEARGPQPDPKSVIPHLHPGGMEGLPFAVKWGPFLSALAVPCQRPPYGVLTAIDLKTRAILWRRALGDARGSGPFGLELGLPLPLGAPNIGGAVITRSGLIFIAATQDEMFRAIDLTTGRTLWQDHLPASGHATPMTYRGSDGRQYVLIAAGGKALRDKGGDMIVAYRLDGAGQR
jgi:membrane-bound PQQ-dependent dehydrogenase (glucose/quinate/shikimate family)